MTRCTDGGRHPRSSCLCPVDLHLSHSSATGPLCWGRCSTHRVLCCLAWCLTPTGYTCGWRSSGSLLGPYPHLPARRRRASSAAISHRRSLCYSAFCCCCCCLAHAYLACYFASVYAQRYSAHLSLLTSSHHRCPSDWFFASDSCFAPCGCQI